MRGWLLGDGYYSITHIVLPLKYSVAGTNIGHYQQTPPYSSTYYPPTPVPYIHSQTTREPPGC
jgi:hypothetical protein